MSPDIHTLSGAYVLDAIEPDERTAFEAHLRECESCSEEVDALRAAAVALAEPMTPPPGLRARVLAAAEHTAQLPPLVERAAPPAPVVVRRKWGSRLLAAAAAIVLFVGVGVTIRLATDDDSPPAITAAQVFGSSDARVKSIALEGGQVRVGVSEKLDRIAVDGAEMPALPEGSAYQLWLVHDGHATSISVMEDDVTTAVEEIPADGVLAVTTEPSGGSDQPTSQPILTVDPSEL